MSAVPPTTSSRSTRSTVFGRVLIVDDNPELVGALKGVLESVTNQGAPRYEVHTASCGKDALRLADEEGFDVAIVDVKLPDVSGVDLIVPLRASPRPREVVLITGYASVDAAIGALRSGAFAFVSKSFRPEELISTVDQALTKVHLTRGREVLERRYRSVVELTDVLVVALDADQHVQLFNRKAANLAGVDPDDALGRDFLASWIPAEERPRMREAILQAETSDRTREVEADFVEGSPEQPLARRRVRWHLSRAQEEQGPPIVYMIGIDVTERRALEKRAADAEALSAMGALALNLAHEIRNPLNAAVLQLHLLDRQIGRIDVDEATRSQLQGRTKIVGDEIGRLNRLLTEFLELARPRGIAKEPVHVGKLVDDVLDLERDSARMRGVTLVRDVAEDGCVAIGDQEKLKQVVINLVVNALEAMKDGGTLTARVKGDDTHVTVELEDTGPGIAAEIFPSLFDPFFTTKEAGTGLGLSIVRKIVDSHAGDVAIESERGRGTKVRVRIPSGR